MKEDQCPLCGWDALSQGEAGRDSVYFLCQLCGRFRVSHLFSVLARALDEQDKTAG